MYIDARRSPAALAFEKTWTEFDLDWDRYLVHEASPREAVRILKAGLFSCAQGNDHRGAGTHFFEGLKQGYPEHVYFLKPKKHLLEEQRRKGYRLDFGPHQRGEKFYSVGPLLRMDGTDEPLTDHCTIQARDSLMLLSGEYPELTGNILPGDGRFRTLEDPEDFQSSAGSAIRSVKAQLWKGHYSALRDILREGKPFTGANLVALVEHLPVEMRNMRNVSQNFGHLGLDPLEHSFIALQITETSPTFNELMGEIPAGGAACDELARCAILYHDLGKKLEPFDPYHARLSGAMCEFHLAAMGYNPLEVTVIKRLVETHDVMGRIKKGEISCSEGYIEVCRDLPETLPRETMIKLHCEVAGADIGSIPYLHGVRLDAEREELLRMARLDGAKD
jgi:hypothetical protein